MTDQKNILFILPNGVLGGAEFVQKSLIETSLRDFPDWHFTILFISSKGLHHWDSLPEGPRLDKQVVSSGDSYLRGLILSPLHIIRICRRQQIATVFASQMYLNTLLCLLKMTGLLRTRLLIRESTQFLKRFGGMKQKMVRFMYRFYHYADRVILQTPTMLHTLQTEIPGSASWNLRVLNNPLSIEPIDAKAGDTSHLPQPVKPYLVAAGRLIPEKGFDVLIRAFAALPADYHLYILGSGPGENDLKAIISRLGLEQRVHLNGHADNPIAWFRQAHACVVSSRIEGFPNTLLQMMTQCGRIVSTHCTGEISDIPHIFTCPADRVEDLTACLLQSVALSDTAATENKQQQRHYIQTHHNFIPYQNLLFR